MHCISEPTTPKLIIFTDEVRVEFVSSGLNQTRTFTLISGKIPPSIMKNNHASPSKLAEMSHVIIPIWIKNEANPPLTFPNLTLPPGLLTTLLDLTYKKSL